MLFQSTAYLLFLPTCVLLYWAMPRHWRIHFLLVASYLFYASWSVPYAIMMFALVVFNWGAAVAAVAAERGRTAIIIFAIAVDLGILALFKYSNFLTENTYGLIELLGGTPPQLPLLQLVLPLGISFFTFEFIHFLYDIKHGALPSRNFSEFHVFSAFFPTQIAGPIKRFQDFLPQIDRVDRLTGPLVAEALALIIRGLFKKVALADNLAPIANAGFAAPASLSQLDAWAAVLAFAFQIYFDFSGYTDIARGSALLFGYEIPLNFRQPYLARNVADFWERWHISLSRWLRDYLFIPLGGSRVSKLVTARNLLITMLLGGLWHGAAWQFIFWGAYWGLVLVVYHQWRTIVGSLPAWAQRFTTNDALKMTVTFVLVLVGWCFFRAPVTEALQMIAAMFRPNLALDLASASRFLVVLIIGAGWFSWVTIREQLPVPVSASPAWVRSAAYAALLLAAFVGAPQESQPFIYFQF